MRVYRAASQMAKKLKRLTAVNASVYVGHYGRLIREAAAELLADSTSEE